MIGNRLYLVVTNGKWWWCPGQPVDVYVGGHPNGMYYMELHKSQGAPKTIEQQGYYYGVVIPHTLKALKEMGNDDVVLSIGKGFKHIPLMKDNVDMLLKSIWSRETNSEIKSKSEFSLEEYSELIDISIMWVAKWLNYSIPPPNKDWRKKDKQ
jgi:hypothetical protein